MINGTPKRSYSDSGKPTLILPERSQPRPFELGNRCGGVGFQPRRGSGDRDALPFSSGQEGSRGTVLKEKAWTPNEDSPGHVPRPGGQFISLLSAVS